MMPKRPMMTKRRSTMATEEVADDDAEETADDDAEDTDEAEGDNSAEALEKKANDPEAKVASLDQNKRCCCQ